MRALLTVACLLLASPLMAARAQAQGFGHVCNPKKEDCGCERNWGCWELLYTTKGTLLGATVTGTHVESDVKDTFDANVLTTYRTEHFGTKHELSGHVLLHGAIGGGTAGTEGRLEGAADFGLRLSLTPTSGPFLRMGPSGLLLDHERLSLAYFAPLQSRIGYQSLDGDHLLEAGLTSGLPIAGHVEAAGAQRGLGYSMALGAYVTLRAEDLRAEASLVRFATISRVPSAGVWLARGAICSYQGDVAICVELLDVRAEGVTEAGALRPTRALYSGLTLALTP